LSKAEAAFLFFQTALDINFQADHVQLGIFGDGAESSEETGGNRSYQQMLRRPQTGLALKFRRSSEIDSARHIFRRDNAPAPQGPDGAASVKIGVLHVSPFG